MSTEITVLQREHPKGINKVLKRFSKEEITSSWVLHGKEKLLTPSVSCVLRMSTVYIVG